MGIISDSEGLVIIKTYDTRKTKACFGAEAKSERTSPCSETGPHRRLSRTEGFEMPEQICARAFGTPHI